MLEAPAGGVEHPAEALLAADGGSVLACGVLPAFPGGPGLPVAVFHYGLEAADLLVEPAAFGVDETYELFLGGAGVGQLAAGLAALPPASSSISTTLATST